MREIDLPYPFEVVKPADPLSLSPIALKQHIQSLERSNSLSVAGEGSVTVSEDVEFLRREVKSTAFEHSPTPVNVPEWTLEFLKGEKLESREVSEKFVSELTSRLESNPNEQTFRFAELFLGEQGTRLGSRYLRSIIDQTLVDKFQAKERRQ